MYSHSHAEAVGEIKESNPWIEDVWRVGPLTLVHWQNLRRHPFSSGPTPRHVWRLLGIPSHELILHSGIAPR
jgi:hypothetical protein